MSAVQYPFIDIAVHERVRDRFAAGEAIVLFSPDMKNPLWANGRGANLFGFASIYDFLDQGPNRIDIAFRQAEAASRQLRTLGDIQHFTIRVASGFQRIPVQAACELIKVQGETTVLFSAPVEKGRLSPSACAARMIEGFDDPDTHMAVIDGNGEVLAASPEFADLGVTAQTAKMLATMAGSDPSRLAKRPIPTVKGYLPAAIGKLSDDPALHLLFTVETAESRIAAEAGFEPKDETPGADRADEVAIEAAPVTTPANQEGENFTIEDVPVDDYADVITAVSEIGDTEEPQEEVSLEAGEVVEADRPASRGGEPAGQAASEDAAETVVGTTGTVVHVEETAHDVEGAETPEAGEAAGTPDSPEAEIIGSASSVTEQAAEDAASKPAGFAFHRDGRATRFVWKIDAEGRFSEVSNEFSDAVGPHAADINGMAFTDLAALFHLDPGGKIAELLNKRDTWSGKTIWWPVEGTSLMVPVDLAALPTYTRTREFDGFRGFGIVRIGDATEDPNAIGLTLTRSVPEDVAEAEASTASEPDEAQAALSVSPEGLPLEWPSPEEDVSSGQAPSLLDWPEGERPALKIVDNPGRRLSDKVIQLEERRPARRDGLTPGEQAAFREIARQLDGFIDRREEEFTAEAPSAPETPSVEPNEPVAIDPDQDPHALLSGETKSSASEEIIESPVETAPETKEMSSELVSDVEEDISGAETGTFAEEAEEISADATAELDSGAEAAVEEPAEPAEKPKAASEEPAGPPPELSDRELLSQMIPVRERIGLSAEIIDQMPIALLVHNGDVLIHGNPEFLRLTGYSTIEELAELGGLDALLQRQDLEDKTADAGGMAVVRADDIVVPVTARLQSVRWDDSTALMLALMPIVSENTASTESSETAEVIPLRSMRPADQLARLQVEVEELRAILETATDGVVIIGAEGDIRSMNRSASALFNYDNEEINGKPFVTLFAHESQRAILDYLSGLSGHGVASVLNDGREVIGREASGGFLPLFMTIGKLTSSNGYCAVIRDITQWKRTEEELRTAKRSAETANAHKSEFLAHVSHEIRTPLNAIIGFADMMATERFGPIGHPRYVEYANDIGRSGRHVLDIVNDLLDISKIEAGEMELDFIAVGLNETVSEAVSLVQPQANGQRVIIRTALSHAVPPVVADLRSVKQIVLNILSNAIRFTPSGGQIVVSTAYETNGNVVLRVRDTGIGMTRSELELAMKPFRQVPGATRKRGDGTGLGLPLTKAMVDANRAAFAITSAPNEGTLVEITFPSPRVLAN